MLGGEAIGLSEVFMILMISEVRDLERGTDKPVPIFFECKGNVKKFFIRGGQSAFRADNACEKKEIGLREFFILVKTSPARFVW